MKATDYTSEAKAAAYANYRFGQGLEAVNRDELYLLQKYLASTSLSESSVLVDLGSGTGRIIDQLLKTPVKTIYAVDLSNAMLDQLEKKYVRELKEKKIKTIVASSDKTGLKLNSANGITAFHLFKHLSKIDPTLKEASRILEKDGFLIFEALNNKSLVRFYKGTCYLTSEKILRKRLKEHNFEVIAINYLHPFGETIYKIPIPGVIHFLENLISIINPQIGSKIFVFAQKI